MSVPELTLHLHVSYQAQQICPTTMGFTQESAGGTGFPEPFGGSSGWSKVHAVGGQLTPFQPQAMSSGRKVETLDQIILPRLK